MKFALGLPCESRSGRYLASFVLLFLTSNSVWAQTDPRDEDRVQSVAEATEGANSEKQFKSIEPPLVKRIVMFNSGLTQIVHEGTVDGNNRVEMKFTGHDVDDVLKSLVFEDKHGGIIRSVEYKPAPDSQDVAAQKLGPPMTLAQTMLKFRGELVTVEKDKSEIKGNIVSVENRQEGPIFVETLTLINEDGFVSLSLSEIERIKFADEKLREDFQLAMIGLAKSRAADLKTLGLLFEGDGKREVRFSYNVDAPIWRMTYRLQYSENKSSLQGWAHIDNVTGVDWTEIELDLRSGRPQSFHVDIFAPLLAERTSIGVGIFDIPTDRTLVPQWFGFDPPARFGFAVDDRSSLGEAGGFGMGGGGFGRGGGGFGGGGGGFGGGGGGLGGGIVGRDASNDEPLDIDTAFQSSADGGRLTKMVRFKIKDPVTLKAGRSAMVPVVSAEIPVELFSMLDADNPDQPAELYAQVKNTSDLPLIPGPIAFYQKGDFVGDGIMKRIEQGAIDGFVYGADTPLSLFAEPKKTKQVTKSVNRKNDQVVLNFELIEEQGYVISNRDALPRKILLKILKFFEKVEPKPDQQIANKLLYNLECKPNSTIRFDVVHTDFKSKQIALKTIRPADLDLWKKTNVSIEPALADTLGKIFELKSDLSKVRTAQTKAASQVQATQNEQDRIIKIMRVLEPDAPSSEKYLEMLAKTETQLETARQELETLKENVTKLELELEEMYFDR